ncbi:unnamed protein product [Closterium sp. NIES-53]
MASLRVLAFDHEGRPVQFDTWLNDLQLYLLSDSKDSVSLSVWGPTSVSGLGRERYFLLVVDDYTRYTTVFPLRSMGEVHDVLIPWIRAVRLQLRERFREDLPVLRLHSDRGGEFSSDLLREFCRGEGILQSFMLPASPRQNGIAEHRIGLVMEVARTSMIHAAAPHFLWPFAVWYAAHQLNLWPRVSLPKTSPTLRWTGEVGDASVFWVWVSRAFVRDTSADKLSAHAIPGVFLGFPPDAPSWQFYHPTSRRVFPSQDVTFDELVSFSISSPTNLPLSPPRRSSLLQVPLCAPIGIASGGAAFGGAEPGGAELAIVEPRGAEPEGVEPGGAESEGAESVGAEPWRTRLRSGAAGAGDSAVGDTGARGVGATRLGGAGVTVGAGGTGGAAVAGPGGARTRGTGVAETGSVGGAGARGAAARDPAEPRGAGAGGNGAGGAGARGAGAGDPGAIGGGAGGTVTGGAGAGGVGAGGAVSGGTGRRVPRPCPPPVPDTHTMALRPSSVALCVPLPPPPESSLPAVLDSESELARAASPTVSRLLATVVTDPFFESTAASALVSELVDFAAACRLDYATALVAESESASPPSVGGECALGTDVLEVRQEDLECLAAAVPRFASMLLAPEGDPDAPDIPTPRSYAEAITGPYSSQWQAAMDAEMASWKSTGTYDVAFPPSRANIVVGMWIFRRDYELHSLEFSTAFLQGSLHEEIWLRHPPGFTGSYPVGTQWSLRRPVYGLRQAPSEWHDTLRTTLAALGFTPSTVDPSLFLRTDTTLPPFYVLVYVDDLVFATADTEGNFAPSSVPGDLPPKMAAQFTQVSADEDVERRQRGVGA